MRSLDITACRSVTLCGICLVAFAAITAGQGYRPSATTVVGATSTTLQLQQLYKSSQNWKIDYRLQPSAACSSTSRNNLCAAAATDSVDAYYQLVMATSPGVYSTTNSSQAGAANLVSPPGDQQACQSCSAFAVGAAAETAMASALRVNAQDCSISVQSLYFCPSDRPAPSCNTGWDLPSVLTQLQDRGQAIPTTECLPYNPDYKGELNKSETCSGICEDPNRYATQGQFSAVKITTIWEAQRHIRHYGSVVTRFDVFSDFRSFFADKQNAKKVYSPSATASSQYGHAVVLVGYDNEKQFWLAKNSWGSQWGDGGFFRVAYGVCSVLTLDTGEAYGVIWTPTVSPSSIALTVVPVADSTTCYEYKALPGDYLSKIAWLTGIPLDKFMLDNVGNVKDVDVLTPGTSLLLCNPKRGIQADPVQPTAPSSPSITLEHELNALLDLSEATFRGELAWEWSRENAANGAYCNWTGIYCKDGKVTYITLQAAGLTGPLPDSLGNLTSLDTLVLTENHLDGTLPPSLGQLPKLRMIYLTDNKIEGTVPPEWIGLSDTLVYLDLSGNMLTGPLPEWFSGFTAMKASPYGTLVLGSNRFSGTVPNSWSALGKLYLLNMNYNRDVKGCVPSAWKDLSDITWSVMNGTGLTGYCSTP